MVVFSHCKINLGLHIRKKRKDGYHDLETIFYPIQQKDILEIIHSPTDQFQFWQNGLQVQGNPNENLCVQAYNLLKNDFPDLPAVEMFLYKTIPTGAGLGGGSADAAFALQLLNDKFKLNISQQKLSEYALQLGSDCPFFILNRPAFATSRGENLKEIELNLTGYHLVVVNPGIHINTGEAFQHLHLKDSDSHFSEIINHPIQDWKNILYNDFEPYIFEKYHVIADLKQKLYDCGAEYASMSGTGSTCFGIFPSKPEDDCFPETYFRADFIL